MKGVQILETKFRQMPGLLYDAISMMALQLNSQEVWIDSVVNPEYAEEDTVHVEYWLSQYPTLPESLRLFFHLPGRKERSPMHKMLEDIIAETDGKVTDEKLLGRIEEKEWLTGKLLNFYFPGVSMSEIMDDPVQFVEKLTYPAEIKFLLLSFLTSSHRYISDLSVWMQKYYKQTQEIYRLHTTEILQWAEEMEEATLVNAYQKIIQTAESGRMDYSLAYLMRNTLTFHKPCLILGQDYSRSFVNEEKEHYDMEAICNALGDKNRLSVFVMLEKEGEKTSADIAKFLQAAQNTVSYHLDIMVQAKVLYRKPAGKTVRYRINRGVCAYAAEQFSAWSI